MNGTRSSGRHLASNYGSHPQTRPGLEPRAAPGSSSPLYVYGTYASKLRYAARLALTETKSNDGTFQMLTSSHGFRVQPQGILTAAVRARLLSSIGVLLDARLQAAQSATTRNRNRPAKDQAEQVMRLMNSTRNGVSKRQRLGGRWGGGGPRRDRGWSPERRPGLRHPCTCTARMQASYGKRLDWR